MAGSYTLDWNNRKTYQSGGGRYFLLVRRGKSGTFVLKALLSFIYSLVLSNVYIQNKQKSLI